MSLTAQSVFNTNNTITITLEALADNNRAVSSAIDNRETKYDVAEIVVNFKTGSSFTGSVVFGIFKSVDGTNYDSLLTARNVLHTSTNLSTNTSYSIGLNTKPLMPLPAYWKFVVRNISGAAFPSGSSDFSATYTGIKETTSATLITTSHKTITTTIVLMAGADNARLGLAIHNSGDVTIYIGRSTVEITTGFGIPAGETFVFQGIVPTTAFYGIIESGTCTAEVMVW